MFFPHCAKRVLGHNFELNMQDDDLSVKDYVLRDKESDGAIHFDDQSVCRSVSPSSQTKAERETGWSICLSYQDFQPQ